MKTWKDIFWVSVLTILYIACFPVNPLVLTGIIEVDSYPVLNILGWVVWTFGMVLVMAPIVIFPRRGGVPKGKSFVKTTRLVDTGVYSVIRHPQYTGGIYAIFLATFLFYPHWLFAAMGAAGTVLTYFSIKVEDKILLEKFGSEYALYRERVPGMNIFAGIYRLVRNRRNPD